MYDAIIVGARCAGSPTAMLLARKGYKVLLVDKASFPSDTISTHIIWPRGAERLSRWGLIEKIAGSNCPLIRNISFDVGPFILKGSHLPYEGVSDCYAPRRTVLDKILLDAAGDAGAEIREACPVEEVIVKDDRVTGVRCKAGNGTSITESARVVIGADGRNSILARSLDVEKYNVKPVFTCAYYTYWSGVPTEGIEFYLRPERAIGCIPTNDGLVCLPIMAPTAEFEKYRANIESYYMKSLELVPDLAERVRQGKREERFFGIADIPNFFRKPFGRGWALVGDAGHHKDSIGAQGISDAFRDAENLTEALNDSFSGKTTQETALARYEEKRNEELMPMYEFNSEMASLEPPPPEMQQLFGALYGNQTETDQFFGMLSGTVPVPEFFSPKNTGRIIRSSVVRQ